MAPNRYKLSALASTAALAIQPLAFTSESYALTIPAPNAETMILDTKYQELNPDLSQFHNLGQLAVKSEQEADQYSPPATVDSLKLIWTANKFDQDHQPKPPPAPLPAEKPAAPLNVLPKPAAKAVIPEQITAWMEAAGITDQAAAYRIVYDESRWRPDVVNRFGCIGLGQACSPGLKQTMLAACPDWATNPVCQLQVVQNYANERYGGWQQALWFHLRHGWF